MKFHCYIRLIFIRDSYSFFKKKFYISFFFFITVTFRVQMFTVFVCLKRDKHFDQKFEQKFSFIYIYFHRSLLISSKYKLLQWLIEE